MRRSQILDATIAVIAEHGAAGLSLQSVADVVGITKAAVIYHVGTKQQLVKETYEHVLARYIDHIAREVDAAPDPRSAVVAYLRAQTAWLQSNRDSARLIVEALATSDAGIEDAPHSPRRHDALTAMLTEALGLDEGAARIRAVVLAGATDAAISAWLDDPGFDVTAATEVIEDIALMAPVTPQPGSR
ncbi:TetR/AcrR family transcriptional regulator [Microbacterium sp. HD4P20]|uniref:TetR/AcrR family transcriptional regulator n=1 Tax=Microbacterium sp. HD4P20 TaxID=2864874 RepID=UPI001C63BC83|nr:TetR/AcrR family transcriptional regulator [Microbacterium sp. HD4P20]MCP2635704.1 TetR/AcrR family transcriptional regulator [Microbacterium sp. HD4P20]